MNLKNIDKKSEKGNIYAIGGALDISKENPIIRAFLKDITDFRGNIRLVIFPSDIEKAKIDFTYKEVVQRFEELGISDIAYCAPIKESFEDNSKCIEVLSNCTGVFFSGGSQRKLINYLASTKSLETIKKRNQFENLTIAGTSAGCAALSETCILGGVEEPELSKGFGFINNVILDQHFSTGNQELRIPRIVRLKKAITLCPNLLGVGVDENTCALFTKNQIKVLGEGKVTFITSLNNDLNIEYKFGK